MRVEAQLLQPVAHALDICVKSSDALRLPLDDLNRLLRAHTHRRRQRVAEQTRAAALDEQIDHVLFGRDESARRAAKRFAERAGDTVDLPEQAKVVGGSST